jgi:Flagellar P-ring protein
MNHRVGVLGVLLLGLVGCAHHGQTRFQAAEEPDKDAEVKTVGDVTSVDNANPAPVRGLGLVVNLDGTGGTPPEYRVMMEDMLRKKGVEDAKKFLASRDVAVVVVSAMIPAGARKGDPLDLEVMLPPNSKATSLKNGYLQECFLYNYESARNLDPQYAGPDRLVKGHPIAVAEGPLLVGLGDGDEAAKQRQGKVWGGGRCRVPRPFYLVLNADQQYARLASAIADRINETFQGSYPDASGNGLAVAHDKALIYLNVPEQYRHNQPRFLRVVRLMPLREPLDRLRGSRQAGASGPVAVGAGSPYRRKLEQDLLDPDKTITAALRLEALGTDSVPALKQGLESEHVLVRFASAEALAYLGSPSCGEELARLVEQQPVLRAFSLTALASLNEAVSHVKLTELLRSRSAEARYGAFRALRALDENDATVQGEHLNESFWLHRVEPQSPGLVHVSSSRRPEVILFGEEPRLVPPFSLLAHEFTLTAGEDDTKCTISRIALKHGRSRHQCPLKLEDVLRTMAAMGATYPDVVELLGQMDKCRTLTCRLAVDALPQATSVYDLAKSGHDLDSGKGDEEVLKARADFGATPNLFEAKAERRSRTAAER